MAPARTWRVRSQATASGDWVAGDDQYTYKFPGTNSATFSSKVVATAGFSSTDTTAAVNIAGCILTDDPSTNKYAIPAGTILQPRSFALFTETTLGFRLSAEGETVLLRQPGGGEIVGRLVQV